MAKLDEKVRELARQRAGIDELKERIALKEKLMASTPEGRRLAELQTVLVIRLDRALLTYDDVRETAAFAYAETGSKHPHPAVPISMFTTYEFDQATAIKWAISHKPDLLQLNGSQFKKHAKKYPLLFVKIGVKPVAKVATDLSEYVE